MAKHFTLLLLFIGNIFFSYSKTGFQLVELSPSNFDQTVSKTDTRNFRFDHTDYFVLKLPVNNIDLLYQNNITIEMYLGDGYYFVSSESKATKSALQNIHFENAGYLDVSSKIEESLKTESIAGPVTILYAASTDEKFIREICSKEGIQMLYNDKVHSHFTTYANSNQLKEIAEFPFVYYITKYYEKKNPLMYESSMMMAVNEVQEVQPYGFNLKGDSISVGIWDEGTPGFHYDLPVGKNIVIDKLFSHPGEQRHATEVGGCVGGQGNLSARSKGIAPRCSMYYWDFTDDVVKEISEGKSNYGIDISNHSYNFGQTTCFESGLYIPESADLDKLVFDNPTMLPVVAVGNTASSICGIATDTFSSVDIGFQGCKNVITVGYLFPDKRIVEQSGRGPTSDGRLKPELVAKGFNIGTTEPNNAFTNVFGSSYASPQIAGLAALLYQKYKRQFGIIPNGALVKAVLCNTARDLGRPGPDYTYGFGIPDAFRAVNTIDKNLFYEDNVAQGVFRTQSISVPSNISQLKITLSWTDKEGNPIAVKSLVNNLDLKLVTPIGDTILPWKLNPLAYKNNALRGVDNVNNTEQITMDNPASGNYTIVVKGSSVPFGPQNFAVAYMPQERKIELTHPNGGERLDAGDANKIRWFANGIDTLAKIEFSSDSGANWQLVVNNQQLSTEFYAWSIPIIASNKCLVRISAGNNIAVSAATFTIAPQINFPLISHTVCDRTINITWPAVANATGYKIYLFTDSAWSLVGQTNLLAYRINNLINGKIYMYAISTISNGVESNHSLAKTFITTPNSCTSTNNDVGVYGVYKPLGGRKLTSSALKTTENLSFIIKNYGTNSQNSIPVSYTINGGPVRTVTSTDVVTANDSSIAKFAVNEDLSATGNYVVTAWTSHPSDVNAQNDTFVTTIRQLPNPQLVLPYFESFETLNGLYSAPAFGLSGLDFADYNPEPGARLRGNEGSLYALTGNKSLALDNYVNAPRRNEVIFTFNLAGYKNDSIVFLDFNYLNRGETDGQDSLFARGDDNRPWIFLYDLYANRGAAGTYKQVKEINLYQKLRVENGQQLQSGMQLRIVQTGSKATTSPYGDGGYSFDDLKLYVAGRDVSLVDASVKKVHCNKSFTPQPITVKVRNNSSQVVTNLPVFYKVNNNTTVSEIIPGPINVNDTATYTFSTLFNYNTPGYYSIQTWVENPQDNYRQNDSMNNLSVIVMKTIDSFPYYNDFETDNGNFFSEGVNNSWVWGTPQKYNMNDAAQESKAWTTGLNKGYNFNENSYLYMGCMDFSSLTTDPLISFNFISVMQTQSDSAYAEYSTDGTNWNRLGCFNCGLNWYNGYPNKPYWDQIIFPWQVAHTIVPLASLADSSNFMYRIHLMSDEYVVTEGLGIDDLHILKDYQNIRGKDSAYVTQVSTGNGWIQFYRNGTLVAELNDDNKNLGTVTLGFESDTSKQKEFDNQTIFPRNWVVKPQNKVLGNYTLRLYVLNSEYTNFILNEDSINRMGDIRLLRYLGLNTNLDVGDNHVTSYYKFYTPQEIQFYPYLNGYYVEFTTDTLGEFYLISTKQDKDAIQNINLIDFHAQKVNDDVFLEWKTTREVNSKSFVIQYSFDASTFIDVDTVPAGGSSVNTTLYNYLHQLNATNGVYYYRIKMVDNQNKVSYSLIDSVYFAPSVGVHQNTINIKSYISENDIVVEMSHKLQTLSNVQVYNSIGQLQFSKKMQMLNGVNPLGIAGFIHWPNGAYFLRIETDEHSYYSKLVKQ